MATTIKLEKTPTPWEGIPDDYTDYEGFIYLVTNKITGVKYVGRKYFWTKKKTKIVGESDWKTYKTSSNQVKEDILTYGLDQFVFEILSVHRNRAETNYAEVREQIQRDVLYALQENGTEAYYNRNIMSRYFKPKELGTPEYAAKCDNISQAIRAMYARGAKHPMEGKVHPNRGKKLPQTAHKKNVGKYWVTNGEDNLFLFKDAPVPDGFYKGVTQREWDRTKIFDITCIVCNKVVQVSPRQQRNKTCSVDCANANRARIMKEHYAAGTHPLARYNKEE